MDGLTETERMVLSWMVAETANGGWFTARQIADYSGTFRLLSSRAKAGAMTAVLRRLHAGGYVEKDRTELPTIWRHKRV